MDDETAQNIEQEQMKAFYDDEERKQRQDFIAGTRKTPLSNNVLLLMGKLIEPQTTGYPQVNLDMSFTDLGDNDVIRTRDSSFIINFCRLYKLRKSEYMERGYLATLLNSAKSHNGKTMKLFTHTVTKQEQEYKDMSEKKTGFLSFLPKKDGNKSSGI